MAADVRVVLFALDREARPFLKRRAWERVEGAPCPAWRELPSALGVEGSFFLPSPLGGEGDQTAPRSPPMSLLVLQTGIGDAATARALDWLLATHAPTRVLSAGFCGSLVPEWPVGSVLHPGEITSAAGELWTTDRDPAVRLVSVDAPVLGAAARRELHTRTGAVIVDMESATAARLCAARGVPFGTVRVVSDDPAEPLPDDLLPALDGERILAGRLMMALAARPRLAVELMRLARNASRCSRILAGAVESSL